MIVRILIVRIKFVIINIVYNLLKKKWNGDFEICEGCLWWFYVNIFFVLEIYNIDVENKIYVFFCF